jgi:dihydropteroate synthase
VLDPGWALGKTSDQNLAMLEHQSEFLSLGQSDFGGLVAKI